MKGRMLGCCKQWPGSPIENRNACRPNQAIEGS
jgi:hypothetical protein